MHFIDEVQVTFQSGSGGNRAVSFRREKFIPKGGPDGGNSVVRSNGFLSSNKRIKYLSAFLGKKVFQAQNGSTGTNGNRFGAQEKIFILKYL